jgi:ariadne-1
MGVSTLLRKLKNPRPPTKKSRKVSTVPELNKSTKTQRPKKKKHSNHKAPRDDCVIDNDTAVFDVDSDGPIEQHEFDSSDTASESEAGSEGDNPNFIGDYPFFATEERGSDFAVLSPAEIVREQEEVIDSLADLLSIDKSTTGNLLRHFAWNKEKLLSKYFENPEKVCEMAGVTAAPVEDQVTSRAVQLDGEAECTICGELTTPPDSTALSCLHRFCNSCWRDYLTMQIQEGQSTLLHCMHYQCNLRVAESVVKRIVAPEVFDKYARFVISSFVEDNDNVKWCPTPNCGNAVSAELITGITEVQCVCGYRFCFRCHREAHAPATCEQMKLWEEKCKDDSETLNWVQANAKGCPKCHVAVEKNGGCNHMTCRQCKHEWCWVCLANWKGHSDYYNCTKIEKRLRKEAKKSASLFALSRAKTKRQQRENDRQRYREALERYLKFYQLFQEQKRCLEAIQTPAQVQKIMEGLERKDMTRVQVQFISEAIECLRQCRSVLKYSYVFAYFMNDGLQSTLFGLLQEDLLKTTVSLTTTTNQELPDRLDCVNLTQLAENRRLNLVNFVEQELFQTDDLWSDKPTSPEDFDLPSPL